MHSDPASIIAYAVLIRACARFGTECRRWVELFARRSSSRACKSPPRRPSNAVADSHAAPLSSPSSANVRTTSVDLYEAPIEAPSEAL
jgi:hypothetical protein